LILYRIVMRASLLINCSKREAQEVRSRADFQRRTVSGYIVNIVIRRIEFAEEIASAANRPAFYSYRGRKTAEAAGPRTTLHIYCAFDEARQIRRAARLSKLTMSGFIFHCLHNSWQTEDSLAEIQGKKRVRQRAL